MSPRPNKGRTVGAEDQMRETLRRWLDDHERTVPWLARKMTDAGCPINQSSLWKAIHRDRAIYVNEAVAISAVTGIPIPALAVR